MTMKKSAQNLKTHKRVVAESMKDAEYRAEAERTQFAHEVAMRVIAYRIEHAISQAELGRRVGLRQPHVARLEAGDHEPSLTTLARLSRTLGIEFHINITPNRFEITA
ncbi:MAG: helix-turn-helix transcriptional regulator [Actinomycetota bacterium]